MLTFHLYQVQGKKNSNLSIHLREGDNNEAITFIPNGHTCDLSMTISMLGSFNNNNSNGSENVTIKMISRFFKRHRNQENSRPSHAMTAKKCTKKFNAHAELLFWLLRLLLF